MTMSNLYQKYLFNIVASPFSKWNDYIHGIEQIKFINIMHALNTNITSEISWDIAQ